MPSTQVHLKSTFTEVAPRAEAPELLVEHDGRLKRLRSDGEELHDFGRVGPVECPVAYDPATRTAYRYVCASGVFVKDYSQLRSFSMEAGQSSVLWEMPLNQWALWFLHWIPSSGQPGGQLLGLVAADRPHDGQVSIDHRLFAIDPARPAPKFRPLCRDAYKPLAFSLQRRELAFSGAEGSYILGLKGERLATLDKDQVATAHGACFDPAGAPRIALGGGGIHLWDFRKGSCIRLTQQGRHPVWSPDGRSLWYSRSGGALMCYDLETGRNEEIVAIEADRFPDFWKSRPVAFSRCGRYLAAMLSAKRLKGVTQRAGGIEARERVFTEDKCFCLLDLQRSEFWRIEGRYFSDFRWI